MTNPEAHEVLTDIAFDYAISGSMTREMARHITALPQEERVFIAEQLGELIEEPIAINPTHVRWASRLLCREEISEAAGDIFVDTVGTRPVINFKEGLGTRAWTHGRHSSEMTSGW